MTKVEASLLDEVEALCRVYTSARKPKASNEVAPEEQFERNSTMITSGTVEYTTPRPYDSPSARVALTFAVAPDADPETVTAEVGEMVKRRAVAMLTKAALAHLEVQAGLVAPNTFNGVPLVKEPPASEKPYHGMIPPPEKTEAQRVNNDIMGNGVVENPTSANPAPSTTTSPSEPITDKRLMDEIYAKNAQMRKDAAANPAALEMVPVSINRLKNEYAPPPAGVSTIPQEKRAEFLQRLAAL